jgi:hypothetical protein
LACDGVKWWPVANMVMNLQVPLYVEISWLAEELSAFQAVLCSMELVITSDCFLNLRMIEFVLTF